MFLKLVFSSRRSAKNGEQIKKKSAARGTEHLEEAELRKLHLIYSKEGDVVHLAGKFHANSRLMRLYCVSIWLTGEFST